MRRGFAGCRIAIFGQLEFHRDVDGDRYRLPAFCRRLENRAAHRGERSRVEVENDACRDARGHHFTPDPHFGTLGGDWFHRDGAIGGLPILATREQGQRRQRTDHDDESGEGHE